MMNTIRVGLALLLIAVSSGCATTRDVQDIVSRTNSAMIPTEAIVQKGEKRSDWKGENARIEAFIEVNPTADVTNAALRVRQGMLLAINGQDVYAMMAFEQVKDPGQLVSMRDRALYDLHPHIVWWFKVSNERFDGTPPTDADKEGSGDYAAAYKALEDFRAVCNGLPPGSSIRIYLEEMRAWIAVSYVNNLTDEAIAQNALVEGLNRYAEQFTDDDLEWLGKNLQVDADDLPFLSLKRRLRAKTVVKQYRKVANEQGLSFAELNREAKALLFSIP
jgi:hypothetical protein